MTHSYSAPLGSTGDNLKALEMVAWKHLYFSQVSYHVMPKGKNLSQ